MGFYTVLATWSVLFMPTSCLPLVDLGTGRSGTCCVHCTLPCRLSAAGTRASLSKGHLYAFRISSWRLLACPRCEVPPWSLECSVGAPAINQLLLYPNLTPT